MFTIIKKTIVTITALFIMNAHAVADIKITNAWMRELPPNSPTAAVYLTITNVGDAFDRLVVTSTPIANIAEIHEHVYLDGVMKMQKVDEVLAPVGIIQFKPHGYHIMLLGLKENPKSGTSFPLTLEFADFGKVETKVEVR